MGMKLVLAAAAAVASLAFAAGASAKPKTARCAISSAGNPAYRGPCTFLPEKGGSFDLGPIGRKLFFDDVSSLSVWITEPGVAEVRGLTTGGINSRWGEARRSRKDPACWQGEDFSICVY
jgi:hypothetical protein